MKTETLTVTINTSKHAAEGVLIISVVHIAGVGGRDVKFVVGQVGVANVRRKASVGGVVLFESEGHGVFEVRVMQIFSDFERSRAEFKITRLLPRRGILAGLAQDDFYNAPFESDEITRIVASLDEVKNAARQHPAVSLEQAEFINRKLGEMAAASRRMGRKDWVNLAIGTLVNAIVAGSLGPDVGRFLFQSVNQALSWLLGDVLTYLP